MILSELFNKVVFLLGAGASSDAGCKLSGEMLTSLREEINNLTTADAEFIEYKTYFLEIYHFILASLHYQVTLKEIPDDGGPFLNIEDFVMVLRQLIDKEFIIPYPLIGNWNERILKWESRKGDVFDRFMKFIVLRLVKDWTRFDRIGAEKSLSPIRELLNNPEDIKLNFFSLNYDLVFESLFNSSKVRLLDDGFSVRDVSGHKLRYWSGEFDEHVSPAKINLFKLHGSIDWEYNQDSEEISIKDDIGDGREPLIIFGSYSKMHSFDPFLYILSKFRALLEKTTVLVAVGYSFHDKYINNLLIQQLSQNTDEDVPKKLIIVDPHPMGRTEIEVADELKKIQDTKSINDIINFRQISPERIKLIAKSASQFYADYFSDGAKRLVAELEETESGEKPFA